VTEPADKQLRVLAEQQAALRRVATLVARGVDPAELFQAVARELARQLGAELAAVWQYELDGSAVLLAMSGDADARVPIGARITSGDENLLSMVWDSGRPARHDNINVDDAPGPTVARLREIGIRNAAGAPIVVDGRVWGAAVVASTKPEPLPTDTDERLDDFADLMATAIANAATRDELQASRDRSHALAEQQAALRRVATLVARGASPSEVFSAVAEELARCLHVENASVMRYESDTAAVVLAVAALEPRLKRTQVVTEIVGTRLTLEGDNTAMMVLRTGRPARMESFENATGSLAETIRGMGLCSGVSVPIVVGGRVWGTAGAGSAAPMPPGTEAQMADFADLVATAIANAATRDELIASRARIVAAADDARRRLERDLHDGAQQRLVSLGLKVRLAEASVLPEQIDLRNELCGIASGLSEVSKDLQEISRGIHPAIQSRGGLGPALQALARRCPVPVNLEMAVEGRLPEPVEVAAYYVVAEALTNAAKYAQASQVSVCAEAKGANLSLSIHDDGIGGADTHKGSGLIGLKDRVEVLGGDVQITSPPGGGTSLRIAIPVKGHDGPQVS
jgi:signal transduction histidine kinase